MATRETPGFFNKFLYSTISEKLGRKNEYFNPVTLGADVDRLKKYYENRGFSEVRIDTALMFVTADKKVDIMIDIQEGYRSLIDTLTYRGIIRAPQSVWDDIASAPRISRGDPFNIVLLEDEVRRVLRILNDNGYPNASYVRDSSVARRYASTRNYSVVLTFAPQKRYLFGNIEIRQEVDSARGATYRDDITDDIILAQLDYKPGEYYSQEKRITSEKNLNRLGIFDLRRLDAIIPPSSDTSIYVPTLITYRPRDRHELAPELLVSDENGNFNLGVGLGYTSRNFFGGARTFTTSLRFRTQTLGKFPHYFDNTSDAVSNVDLTFELQQPYVFTNKVRGTWSFSYIVDKQKPYQQNITRNRVGVVGRFAEFTTGYFDWTLEALGLLKNRNYQGDPNDPNVLREFQLLQDQQFNSIASFTLARDKSNDLFSPSEGFIHSMTVEEAGALPLLLKNMFRSLPFTQFYRVILSGRWYTDLTDHRFSVLALKLKAGLEDKYGESRSDTTRTIPQTHRFYAGGGGSVRGWAPRELIAFGEPQFGGNLSVEGSVELRTNLLQSLRDGLFDKIWVVQFVDFGNVWPELRDFTPRTVAIAAGLGLRYDTFFGPFRIDWGFRVYNPREAPGQQWITQRQLFGQTFKEGVFQFGIGHAF
jgi:outer membrane protein assembly factor BamA